MGTVIKLGDIVAYNWAISMFSDYTRYKVVDLSLSGKEWDIKMQSPNSGRIYEAFEKDVSVVHTVEQSMREHISTAGNVLTVNGMIIDSLERGKL